MKLLKNSIYYTRLILVTFFVFTVQAHATDNKILLLGDSLSAGYGLPKEKSWAHLLQQQWQQSGLDHILINASVSGETTTGALARLPHLLREQDYDWIIIELGGNDGLQGKSIKTMKKNLLALIKLSQAHQVKPILFEMLIPPNYGNRYTKMFVQTYQQIATETQTPLVPFFIADVATRKDLMQKDGIHPNAKAQSTIATFVGEQLTTIMQP